MSNSSNLHEQLTQELRTRYGFNISPEWLTNFLNSTRNPPPPLPALVSTINFRILASDITSSLSNNTTTRSSHSNTFLPLDVNEISIKERRLNSDDIGKIIVQVLDIQDIGSSKWSQIEAIEKIERGEETHGREIIRNVPVLNEDDGDVGRTNGISHTPATKISMGPHKLVLQDSNGTKVTAFELFKIPKIGISLTDNSTSGMAVGCKLALSPEIIVRRGMMILQPEHVTILGGKFEAWDKSFREGRKQRLTGDIQIALNAESPG